MTPPAAAATVSRRSTAAARSRASTRPTGQARLQRPAGAGSGRAKATAARREARAANVKVHRASVRPAGMAPLPVAVGRTAGAVLRLPEWPLVHRLTRGRWWIGVLGCLLAGIVAVNVVTLSLSSGSGKRSERIEDLRSSNSELASRVARRTSADALAKRATKIGMVTPEPGDIRYLTTRGKRDVREAARRLRSPQAEPPVTAPAVGPLAPPATTAPPAAVAPPAAAPVTAVPPAGAPTPVAPATAAVPPSAAPAAGAVAAP